MGWKEELKASYDALANDDINASNKEFAKTKSQSWNNALGRGMQRSSYLNATQANYDKSAVDAANQIRNKYNAAYKQAEMEEEERRWQRELQQEQLRLQQEAQALARQQAEWSQSNWQAEYNLKAAAAAPAATPVTTTNNKKNGLTNGTDWLSLLNRKLTSNNVSHLPVITQNNYDKIYGA